MRGCESEVFSISAEDGCCNDLFSLHSSSIRWTAHSSESWVVPCHVSSTSLGIILHHSTCHFLVDDITFIINIYIPASFYLLIFLWWNDFYDFIYTCIILLAHFLVMKLLLFIISLHHSTCLFSCAELISILYLYIPAIW